MQNIESFVKRLMEHTSRDIVYRVSQEVLMTLIGVLMKEQINAQAQHKEGLQKASELLMGYLESVREEYQSGTT